MRFGIPELASTVTVTPQSVAFLPQPPLQSKHEVPLAALNDTLRRLDAISLQKIPYQKTLGEAKRLSSRLVDERKFALGTVDKIFDGHLESLHQSVEAAIHAHEKSQREAEKHHEKKEEAKRKEEAQQKVEWEQALQAKKQKEREEREACEAQEAREKKEKDIREKKAAEATWATIGLTNFAEVEKEYRKYLDNISVIKTSVVMEVDKDPQLKRQVGSVKRKINVRMGQLSNSMTQLRDITRVLLTQINSCKTNLLGYNWILNFVAKAIVSQAETEVTVKPAAALPLARLAVALMDQAEDLYYYLSARIIKKCPLVIGYTSRLDTEQGRLDMGWKRRDDVWEPEVKYEERVGGILCLWAVMARLETARKYPLFTQEAQWRFLARIFNTEKKLVADVHFVVLCNWWEAAAQSFVLAYGSQAKKLLNLAYTKFVALGSPKKYAAATRLQVLGEDLFQRNNFNILKEMEA